MKDSVAENGQGCKPKEEFTGKNLTRFGGAGLVRRFFDKLHIVDHLAGLGTSKRREEDYSVMEVCLGMLYGLMMGIFRSGHTRGNFTKPSLPSPDSAMPRELQMVSPASGEWKCALF